MQARHYAPALGRFLQPDPVAAEANAWAYAENSPVSKIDPGGEAASCAAIPITWWIPGLNAINLGLCGGQLAVIVGGAVIGAVAVTLWRWTEPHKRCFVIGEDFFARVKPKAKDLGCSHMIVVPRGWSSTVKKALTAAWVLGQRLQRKRLYDCGRATPPQYAPYYQIELWVTFLYPRRYITC
jgi:hypothetical protein